MDTQIYPGRGSEPVTSLRFGQFEIDFQRRELRKDGRRVRLQEQPFQILQRLVESPGEVVSREEIRKHLWPDGSVVEFDHSINAAVKRLRDVLRDSTDKPRYIETVARRGYRFIAAIGAAGRSLYAGRWLRFRTDLVHGMEGRWAAGSQMIAFWRSSRTGRTG